MKSFLSAFLILLMSPLLAQVNNDEIANRIQLELDANPAPSNTIHSSVQWDCVNKVLTNKCIVYHNDQWFTFTPPANGRFYLNFTAQACRDERGIQMILIEGDPCHISTYKILYCVDKLPRNDTYVTLDSLRAAIPYLLNIDGFLGDQCVFKVQFSTRPVGIPVGARDLGLITTEIRQNDNVIHLKWQATEDVLSHLKVFRVYRSNHEGSADLGEISSEVANAYGVYRHNYSLTDTVAEPGTYVYRIYGISDLTGEALLLSKKVVNISWLPETTPRVLSGRSYSVSIPVKHSKDMEVVVQIQDSEKTKMLNFYRSKLSRGQRRLIVDLATYVKEGSKRLRVIVSQVNRGKPNVLDFVVDESGNLLRIRKAAH